MRDRLINTFVDAGDVILIRSNALEESLVSSVGKQAVLPRAPTSIAIGRSKSMKGMELVMDWSEVCLLITSSYLEQLAAENERLREQLSQSPGLGVPDVQGIQGKQGTPKLPNDYCPDFE